MNRPIKMHNSVYFSSHIALAILHVCYHQGHTEYYHQARCSKMFIYFINKQKYKNMLTYVGGMHLHMGKAVWAMPVEEKVIQTRRGLDLTKAIYEKDNEFVQK